MAPEWTEIDPTVREALIENLDHDAEAFLNNAKHLTKPENRSYYERAAKSRAAAAAALRRLAEGSGR